MTFHRLKEDVIRISRRCIDIRKFIGMRQEIVNRHIERLRDRINLVKLNILISALKIRDCRSGTFDPAAQFRLRNTVRAPDTSQTLSEKCVYHLSKYYIHNVPTLPQP